MSHGHGGSRPGAGRRKGQTTKLNDEARRKAADGGLMPLDYLLSILRNEKLPQSDRVDAAKAAAPYVHAKLANVELKATVSHSHEDALDELDEPARADDQAEAED